MILWIMFLYTSHAKNAQTRHDASQESPSPVIMNKLEALVISKYMFDLP